MADISSVTLPNGDSYNFKDSSAVEQSQYAYVESGTTASRKYEIGEYFCLDGILYRAKAEIQSGASFTIGTNCSTVTGGGMNQLPMYGTWNKILTVQKNNGTGSFTFPTGFRGVLLIFGNQSTAYGMYLVFSSASTVTTLAVLNASAITITRSGLTATFANSSTTTNVEIYLCTLAPEYTKV